MLLNYQHHISPGVFMIRIVPFLFLALLISCTTSSKQSKLSSLVDTGDGPVAKSDVLLKDLSRTVYVKKMANNPTTRKTEPRETSTWVKFYPYTQPLIKSQVATALEETAFKEKWSDEKKSKEMKSKIETQTKEFVTSKQCFALEINTPVLAAIELKYWYGTLKQAGKDLPLKISKGSGFTQRTTHVTGSPRYGYSSYQTEKYFYFAQACTTKPIQLSEEFQITIDARYEKDLLPIEMSWLKPTEELKQ
jgi:hypothetical protein